MPRLLEKQRIWATKAFPAIVLTGPRHARKTRLLRRLRGSRRRGPGCARIPQGFLDGVETPAIPDEMQDVPEVFAYVYFRDEQGLEVDFVIPSRGGSLTLVESKLTRTVTPSMAAPMRRLAEAVKRKRPKVAVSMTLVHEAPSSGAVTRALAPAVRALPWQEFLEEL